MKGLSGKKALITGASSGIGAAVSARLAAEGVKVAINYRGAAEKDAARKALDDAGGNGITIQGDVSDEREVQAMFAAAISQLGGLDILINNAGIQIETPSHLIDMADFDRVLALDPNRVAAWWNKAFSLRKLGRVAEAEEAERRAKVLGG